MTDRERDLELALAWALDVMERAANGGVLHTRDVIDAEISVNREGSDAYRRAKALLG